MSSLLFARWRHGLLCSLLLWSATAQADALDDLIDHLPASEPVPAALDNLIDHLPPAEKISASSQTAKPLDTSMVVASITTSAAKPITDPTPIALTPIARLQEVALSAISFVGKPYVYGSSNPDVGFDCSGLVQYVLAQSGVRKLPRTSAEMYDASSPINPEDLTVGDLLFFDSGGGIHINHVGIYVGEGRFIHAPSSGGFVRLDRIDQDYWRKALVAGRRVLKLD
jgi:cell wall-associated NlpC family hydrolase